jgi:transcriptional regulator
VIGKSTGDRMGTGVGVQPVLWELGVGRWEFGGTCRFLLTSNTKTRDTPVDVQQEAPTSAMGDRTDVLHGALDLMILRTLDGLGPLHGYGLARRIEQVSAGALALNQGTLYPALLRLEQRGWIASKWGVSDNNRRARFYSLTRRGRAQLATEAARWEQLAALLARFLKPSQDLT